MKFKQVMSVLSVVASVVAVSFSADAKAFTWVLPGQQEAELVDSAVAPYKEVRGESAALTWPWEPAGSPATPYRIVKFAVPEGCAAEDAKVECEATWRTLAEDVAIYPVQEPVPTNVAEPPFTPPGAEFYGAAVWPAAVAEAMSPYIASSVQVLPVRVNVIRYSPRARRLMAAATLKVTVTFPDETESQTAVARKAFSVAAPPSAGADGAAAAASADESSAGESGAGERSATVARNGSVSRELMRSVLDDVANRDEITIADAADSGAGVRTTFAGGVTAPTLTAGNTKIDMVIISPPDFLSEWDKYIALRRVSHPHLNIIKKNTAEIYRDFSGCDEAQKIHHYIESLFRNNGLEYVILGAACPRSGGSLVSVQPLEKAYQIPTRYADTDNAHPCDMYYACMDRLDNGMATTEGEVWDLQNDGLFMRTTNGPDVAKNCDIVPDLVVFRMPLRPYVEDGPEKAMRLIVAEEQMDGFTNKIFKSERLDFAGAHRYLYSGTTLVGGIAKGENNERVVTERKFFDGAINFFDDEFKGAAQDYHNSLRYFCYDTFPKYIGLGDVSHCAPAYRYGEGGTNDGYYRWHADHASDEAHGWARGAANWNAGSSFSQSAIHKLHLSPMPCESGWFDFNGNPCLCASEAVVLNNIGGACAALANCRQGWWGGYNALSHRIETAIQRHIMDKNVGKALLATWQGYASEIGTLTGGGAWSLFNANGMGDPLASITPQYKREWIGQSGGVQEWSREAANWKASEPNIYVWAGQELDGEPAVGFDYSTKVSVPLTASTTFNVACDASTPDLVFNAPAGSAVVMQGAGRIRALNNLVVSNCTDLAWNVAGGAGRNGIKFANARGVLRLAGDAERYFGARLRNLDRIEWTGSNVTLDFGDCMEGGIDTAARALTIAGGTNNVVRSYGEKTAVFGSDYKVNLLNGAELKMETWAGTGLEANDHDNILFYARTNSVIAYGNNPCLVTEYLTRSILLDEQSALRIDTDRFALGNAEGDGIKVFARGAGNRIFGRDTVTVIGKTIFDVAGGGELTLESAVAGGEAEFTGAGTVRLEGAATTTGAMTVKNGAKAVAKTAGALGKGAAVVESGATLEMQTIPAIGLKSLVVKSGGKLILPYNKEGLYQVLEREGTVLQIEDGAAVCSSSAPDLPLNGTATSSGSYMVADSLMKWKGDAAGGGVWSATAGGAPFVKDGVAVAFEDGNKVLFDEVANVATATVTVAGTVKPGFIDFLANDTKYRFTGDGTIEYNNITFARDIEVEANIHSPSNITIAGGRVALSRFNTRHLEVGAGAEFRLKGTNAVAAVPAKFIRFEILSQNGGAYPALEGLSFHAPAMPYAKRAYPNPITVTDYTGAAATRADASSRAYWVTGSGTSGAQALIAGIYFSNDGNGMNAQYDYYDKAYYYYDIASASGTQKPKQGTVVWAPKTAGNSKWFEIALGENDFGGSFAYQFHSAGDATRNPTEWRVLLRANAGDEWILGGESKDEYITTTYSDYPMQVIENAMVSIPSSVTVRGGATLVLDGVYESANTIEAGAKFKALKGRALVLRGEMMEFNLAEGEYEIDATEADGIEGWQKILVGCDFKADDLSRFYCNRPGSALMIDEAGDLCITTAGIATPPFSRTLTESNETWDGAAGDWSGADATGAAVPFADTWNNTHIDGRGSLTITIARGLKDNIVLDASSSDIRVRKIIIRQQDPDEMPVMTLAGGGGKVFAVEEIDLTDFHGTFTLDAEIVETERTQVRVGEGVYYFPNAIRGSLAVEHADGAAHVNYFTEGLAENQGAVALDQGAAEPVERLDADAWQGNLTIAKPVAAVASDGTNGVYHVKNGQTLTVADGATLNVAQHFWSATTPEEVAVVHAGGVVNCNGAEDPWRLSDARVTTRYRMGAGAVLNVPNGAASVGGVEESNGNGELEMFAGARGNFAALRLCKGWIDIHPGAAIYVGKSGIEEAASMPNLGGGLMTVAGTIGAKVDNTIFNIPFAVEFPEERELAGAGAVAAGAAGAAGADDVVAVAEGAGAGAEGAGAADPGDPVATIDLNGNHSMTFKSVISGRGALAITNTVQWSQGTVTLAATNSYAGGTFVAENQTLAVPFAAAIGTGGVTLANDATLALGANARGVDARFAADAYGAVRIDLTAREVKSKAVIDVATVAEGVREVPRNMDWNATYCGVEIPGLPVTLEGNMVKLDTSKIEDLPPSLDYANPVTGDDVNFAYAFIGAKGLEWERDNFFTLNGDREWVPATVTPQVDESVAAQAAAVFDGDIIAKYSLDQQMTSGKFQITANEINGIEPKIGLFNNVNMMIDTINMFKNRTAGAAWFMVDATSKLTVSFAGFDGSEGTNKWFVAAKEGVEFAFNDYDRSCTFEYHFKGEGSFKFGRLTGGTHNLKSATIEIGSEGRKAVIAKTLVAWTSIGADVPFAFEDAAVTVSGAADVEAAKKTSGEPTIDDPLGTYQISKTAVGLVIKYVGRFKYHEVGDQLVESDLGEEFTAMDAASDVIVQTLRIPATPELPAGSKVTIQSIGFAYRSSYHTYLVLSSGADASRASNLCVATQGGKTITVGGKTESVNWVQYNFKDIEVTVGESVPCYQRQNATGSSTTEKKDLRLVQPASYTALGHSRSASRSLVYEIRYTVKSVNKPTPPFVIRVR